MNARYYKKPPLDQGWIYFEYNDQTRQVSLFNSDGRVYAQYDCQPELMDAWVATKLDEGYIENSDLALDYGL